MLYEAEPLFGVKAFSVPRSLRISRMSQIHPSVIETIAFWYYFHTVVLANSLYNNNNNQLYLTRVTRDSTSAE